MKKQILLMVNLFIISCALIAASTVGAAQAKGGGKGGFGEDGAACATFRDAGVDEITSDTGEHYCNGTDGQVSVPKRFRIDLKKFNSNGRFISVDVAGAPLFDGNVIFQSQLQYNLDADGNPTIVTETELDFPSMIATVPRSAKYVSMSIDFKTGPKEGFRIAYAKDDNRLSCPSGSDAQPVEVICTDSTDGPCVAWTVTGSSACLLDLKTETFIQDVQADFSLDVQVIPTP